MKAFILKNYTWLIILVLVSAGSLTAELINKRFEMADLEVYHKTAVRLIHGEHLYRDVEDNPYEHYVYKYSPPAALMFIPFIATDIGLARFIYWFFLLFIFGSVLYNIKVIFLGKDSMNRHITWSLVLATLIVGTHYFRELHLGQVNLLLLGIYIFALRCFLSGKNICFAALLAFSIFMKPFALIFIPFMLITRNYKGLAYFTGFAALFFFIPFIFYLDFDVFLGLYNSWINELLIELGSKQGLLAAGNHTIFSVLARYTPLRFLYVGSISSYLIQLLILGLIAGMILLKLRNKVKDAPQRVYIIFTALIPLLAFTSYNAFIFTLPLITYLLFKFREMNLFYKVLFIISCVLIGANIHDLVGRELFDFFWSISVYSWGAIGLLVIIFTNWKKLSVGRGAVDSRR